LNPQLEISLVLERAKEIRSMDIGRGADVFCAAFVDDGSDQSSLRGNISRLGAGGRLFQTEVLRGTSEADWIWNQVLPLQVPFNIELCKTRCCCSHCFLLCIQHITSVKFTCICAGVQVDAAVLESSRW
jgi:hypothetical protein